MISFALGTEMKSEIVFWLEYFISSKQCYSITAHMGSCTLVTLKVKYMS